MKKLWNNFLDQYFPQPEPLQTGVYQYQSPPDVPKPFRLHLRIDQGGESVLIVNAATVLHLNQSATEYAYHLLRQTPPEKVAKLMSKRYRIDPAAAMVDFAEFSDRIITLVETPDLDPTTYLSFGRTDPHTHPLSAPLRLDCAVTYETADDAYATSAPLDRVRRNLTTDEWKSILAKAWNAGIPHVIFTGGEPTLRPDLVDLIAAGEVLGMVTGILTDGLRLAETEYLHKILQAGLDHLMIVLDSRDDQSWEALRDVMAEDLFVTVHLTINDSNKDQIPGIIERLAAFKVPSISLSASSAALRANLDAAHDLAAHHQLELVWDLPVPYSQLNPVSLELKEVGEEVNGAGRSWLYVEPDGDVLPRQGVNVVLGNMLNDSWEAIWKRAREVAPV